MATAKKQLDFQEKWKYVEDHGISKILKFISDSRNEVDVEMTPVGDS